MISVITTVRDGARFLREALESLWKQTDPDFEVVVVDDGSTDETREILSTCTDPRLKPRFAGRLGMVPALLEAVRMAQGDILAVLDADDIAMPHRLARQRAYLEEHPDVALVGSSAIEFDGEREYQRWVVSGPRAVRRALGMYNPFYHSSLMFRRSAYEAVGGYRPDDGWGNDKDLLLRFATRFAVDIIPEPLIRYRRHAASMSQDKSNEDFRGRRSAWLQLRAARELKLPPHLWIVPLANWVYVHLPSTLRPRRLKRPVKQLLLRLLGVAGTRPPLVSR